MMANEKIYLHSADQSRDLDKLASEYLGVDSGVLMKRAAAHAFSLILKNWPGIAILSIFCGKGKNAGDAMLIASLAREYGIKIQIFFVVDPHGFDGEVRAVYELLDLDGLQVERALRPIVGELVVDGLIGTGLNREVSGDFQKAINLINQSDTPVLSLDIPSGVNASTGGVLNNAVFSDLTVTFISRKVGLYTGFGIVHSGKIDYNSLGIPASVVLSVPGIELEFFDGRKVQPVPLNSYKSRQGHLLIVGGDDGMPGAVLMAAEAAMRSGAGLVTIATKRNHFAAINSRLPEAMVLDADLDSLKSVISRFDAILLGPGLGRNPWGKVLYEGVSNADVPLILDADGLYWMAELKNQMSDQVIISPHVGESARLLGTDASVIERDRVASSYSLSKKYGVIGVLKGPGSIIFEEDKCSICGHGNPGMATAGTGDVLAGIIGGLVVQGFTDLAGSLKAAVLLHSAAADLAVKVLGSRSLLATDIIKYLPSLLKNDEFARS